ncbi:MAG: rod shape-determining protein [Acidobacteriota bacterium]
MLRERVKRQFVKQLKRLFVDGVAIDLGTVNTLVYTPKQGIVLNEPSAIAVNKYNNQVMAVGREAIALLGREPLDTVVHRPMREGTIANYEMAEKMLHEFLRRVGVHRRGRLLQAVAGTPSLATGVERRALKAAARGIGAQWISLVEEGLAAALGSGVIQDTKEARMVVDIGGGTTNVTIASSSGVIHTTSLRVAGNEMNQAVSEVILRKYRLLIGEQTAEAVKIQLGAAQEYSDERTMVVVGKSFPEFVVKEITLNAGEVVQALDRSVQAIVNGVRAAIEQAAPNVAVDIYCSGITLTGGGALLCGLAPRMSRELELPVQVAERPLEAVVVGAGHLIGNETLLSRYQLREETLEWEVAETPGYILAN